MILEDRYVLSYLDRLSKKLLVSKIVGVFGSCHHEKLYLVCISWSWYIWYYYCKYK